MSKNFYFVLLHSIWFSQKQLFDIYKDNSDVKLFYENLDFSKINVYSKTKKQSDFIEKSYKEINANQIKEKINDRKVVLINYFEEKYPKLLKEIANPPFLLYVRWEIDNSPKISVVWSRNITNYWEKVIEKIIPDISSYFIVVSWWAFGCDTKAHEQALNAGNKTISVIWTGIDLDYPSTNKKLYDEIVSSWGAVISIFPFWEIWNPYNFPIRNEIVAGLSIWTIVIEAREKSGSLITAKLALDLWRDLFSVPWDIFKANSVWCNYLISNWEAKILINSSDVFDEYNINTKKTKKQKLKFADKIEEDIYNTLLIDSYGIDELSLKISVDTKVLSFKLSMMEISWIVWKTLWWKYEIK